MFYINVGCLACPTIKNRASWGARSPKKAAPRLRGQAQYVIIHHTAGNECSSASACSNQIKTIQTGHIGRDFDDIGYNFLVSIIFFFGPSNEFLIIYEYMNIKIYD